MDALIVALVAVICLGLGLAAGWHFSQRGLQALRDQNDFLNQRVAKAEQDSAVYLEENKRMNEVRTLLEAVTAERDEAMQKNAAYEADKRHVDERIRDLEATKDKLVTQFREIGDMMLDKAQKDFLEKAQHRFKEADQQSEAKLTQLVGPLKELLKAQAEKIDSVEKQRLGQYEGLKAVVEEVKQGQGLVRDEARNLVNALRAQPKARGRWGEKTLENVLEQAGLSEHIDYRTEVSVDGEDGKLRPDAVVNLPGGRQLIIDAKCSLNAYLDAAEEADEDKRQGHLQQHLSSLKNHAQQLGSKAYWSQFEDSADYVIMFVPGEHFLSAALEQDNGLWDWAFERKVLLATPTNLVAIARTVASVWRQEKMAKEAGQVAALGKELHSRIATLAEHIVSMQTNLTRTNNAFNKMVGSFESQVLTQAKRFEDLGAGSAKTLPGTGQVEVAPRGLTKLVGGLNEAQAKNSA
ncbi:DNA recombination protein RmuC [Sphingomicrobium astaxanthinifaciens]|uniref:DNA recombination protein RmuC n=1 Tax=Sphingomicrobium astaxanthinifaciens TaxID=1227949 RepID=UPI001FCAD5C5|nr:DNA recombination protein RmuC [Sphingomicrobium astaxanthinifaciens]MCJ7422192.1 DNA recombination protein RmuC [Sphingomicrobium astaxanthinifaciens]